MRIRGAEVGDLEAINEIYNREVHESIATFDTEPLTMTARRSWLAEHAAPRHPAVVADDGGGASMALHQAVGFGHFATMRRVGEMLGRILDVQLLDLHLDGSADTD